MHGTEQEAAPRQPPVASPLPLLPTAQTWAPCLSKVAEGLGFIQTLRIVLFSFCLFTALRSVFPVPVIIKPRETKCMLKAFEIATVLCLYLCG